MAEGGEEQQPPRRKRRNLLKLYYGVNDSAAPSQIDPTDINSPHFQSEAYMGRLLQSATLGQLMDKEEEMHQQIKVLDRDMQTLVYDNYNKFISATDMIRKMKSDFKKMEDEMEHLSTNVKVITDFSDSINGTLANQRQQISKLSGVHSLLKKLQFIFELPARLNKCMEMGAYPQAVRYYVKARHVLQQYEHMPSFHGIQEDCQAIVAKLKEKLRATIRDRSKGQTTQMAECVELLLRLREPPAELCDEYLAQARHQLEDDLARLSQMSGEQPSSEEGQRTRLASDVLEFADAGCNGILSNISLLIASFLDLFLRRTDSEREVRAQLEGVAKPRLVQFVKEILSEFFAIVKRRFEMEVPDGSDQFLVRALDRYHRKLVAVHKLLPSASVDELAAEMVSSATSLRVEFFIQKLKDQFLGYLADARQAIATQPLVPVGSGFGSGDTPATSAPLSDLLNTISTQSTDECKAALNSLRVYVSQDIMFACQPQFRVPFCRQQVRQGLVVGLIRHMLDTAESMMDVTSSKNPSPPLLVLLMSRLCCDMKDSTISYLVSLSDEAFPASERSVQSTPIADLTRRSGDIAQRLIDHFVNVKGLSISQMIRKSVETRDWLSTLEPRNVRPVMKRVVEDITTLDLHVGQLFEEGSRRDRSSDDSRASRRLNRQTHGGAGRGWTFAPNAFDSGLMSNIQKLFAERIEIFGSVGFNKVAVVTGVVKIALKTFLECVRLRTFGRYGLQQIQVDTHYLQLYLWRFVSDENLVTCLVDEVVSSTIQRCTDPVVMEQSVIEVICEQG